MEDLNQPLTGRRKPSMLDRFRNSGEQGESIELEDRSDRSSIRSVPAVAKKKWCCNTLSGRQCIGLAVILVIPVALVMALGTPRFVQHTIDQSSIEFLAMEISDPELDGSSFMLSGTYTVSGVNIGGEVGKMKVKLSSGGRAFAQMYTPAMKVEPKKVNVIEMPPTKFEIIDTEAWHEASRGMISTKSFEWHMQGSASVTASLGFLRVTFKGIRLRKTIALTGMGSMTASLLSNVFTPSTLPGHIHISVQAQINNPAIFTMYIGDMGCVSLLDGVAVANMTAHNVTLSPGSQVITMEGDLSLPPAAIPGAQRAVSAHLNNRSYPVGIRGRRADSGPFKNLEWLQGSMELFEMTSEIPGAVTPPVEQVVITEMGVDFTHPSGVPQSSSVGSVVMRHLDETQFEVSLIRNGVDMTMFNLDNVALARFAVDDSTPVTWESLPDLHGGRVHFTNDYSPMNVLNADAFGAFVKEMLFAKQMNIIMSGQANPTALSELGELLIPGIPVTASTVASGMDGLNNVEVLDVDIVSTTEDSVSMFTSVRITNPSVGGVIMGRVQMSVEQNGLVLGDSVMPNFKLNSVAVNNGVIVLSDVVTTYSRTRVNRATGRAFLSNFINNVEQPLLLRGSRNSTPVPYLKDAMSVFQLPLSLPGVTTLKNMRLLDQTILTLPMGSRIFGCLVGSQCLVPTQMHISNPFNATVIIHNVTTDIFQCDVLNTDRTSCQAWGGRIGVFTPDRNLGIVVPPKGNVWSQPFAVYSPYSIVQTFATMISASRNRIPIRIVGEMTVQMGNFIETVNYSADDVTTCISSPLQSDCVGEDDFVPTSDSDCTFDNQVMNCRYRAYCVWSPSILHPFRCVLRNPQ